MSEVYHHGYNGMGQCHWKNNLLSSQFNRIKNNLVMYLKLDDHQHVGCAQHMQSQTDQSALSMTDTVLDHSCYVGGNVMM